MHFRCISVLRARSEGVKVLAWRVVALRPNCPAHLNRYRGPQLIDLHVEPEVSCLFRGDIMWVSLSGKFRNIGSY